MLAACVASHRGRAKAPEEARSQTHSGLSDFIGFLRGPISASMRRGSIEGHYMRRLTDVSSDDLRVDETRLH